MENGDNRDRLQVADDDDNDSPTLTSGNITRYRALAARISYMWQDRPDLKFASMQVCCAMARPTMRDMERIKRVGRYFVGKPRACCWFRWQQSGELETYSDAEWGGDEATRRSVSAGLSSAESELHAAVKTASEGLGIQSITKDMGISCGLNLHLDASATVGGGCIARVQHSSLGEGAAVVSLGAVVMEEGVLGRVQVVCGREEVNNGEKQEKDKHEETDNERTIKRSSWMT